MNPIIAEELNNEVLCKKLLASNIKTIICAGGGVL
jgi:hypothetical protein